MNLQRAQSAPLAPIRPSEGVAGPPPPVAPPYAAGGEDHLFFRLNLLRALELHRNLAIGIAAAGLLLAVAYVAMTWPVYIAQSQIYIQPVQSKVMPQGSEQGWPSESTAYDSYIQQQVQGASSPDVLLSALHKLGSGAFQLSNESEQAAVERLGRSIAVARVGTSYEVAITAQSPNPVLSAGIANAVASSIVERAAGQGNAGNEQRIAVLREERDRIQKELDADNAEQGDLNKQLGMAAVSTAAPDLIDNDIGRTREELIKAQTDHDEAEAKFAAMQAGHGTAASAIDAEADDLIASDPGLTSMKTSLNARRAILITQMANQTPNNPAYKQDAAELAKINASLDSMMKDLRSTAASHIQQKLRTNLVSTAGVESRLNGQLRVLAGTAASATPKLQRVSDLETDIVRLRSRYSSVDEQLHNLMLEDSVPGGVHLSVTAAPPLHPTWSGILKKALPLALGGLILGLLAASLANHFDPKVYIAADVEHVLGFAPMAVLPNFDEVSDEVAAEQLLRLSATIEHARKQGSLKTCIFTGTSAGCGVTTVAARVKDILESMGRPTVLVDASGTPPPAPRLNPALDGLNGASDQPATQLGSRSTALVQQVADETALRQESLVLTDTAPLTISAETEYLARFVDCVIVVIESGVTTRPQILATMNTLQRLDVAAVGFVLNRVGMEKADPAFRNSVRQVESHLRTQSVSTSRRAVRTHRFADEPLSAVAVEHFPIPVPSRAYVAPPALEPVSVFVPRSSPPAVPQWPMSAPFQPVLPPAYIPAPAYPALPQTYMPAAVHPLLPQTYIPAPVHSVLPPAYIPAPVQTSLMEPVMSLSEKPPLPNPLPNSAPDQDPDLPWWLTDPHPRPASALWQPAEKPLDPAQLAAPAPDFQSYTPLIRSWDSISREPVTPIYQPPLHEVRPLSPEDNQDGEGSRLGGLRNMLFPHGLKGSEQDH